MRKLATIVQVASCDPIPETERLSVATMTTNSWKVVVGRTDFKPGDLAVLFEIDSAIPSDDERYSFLRERCLRKFTSKSGNVIKEVLRIKTAKLRGVISQGLLIPLDKFPEITDNIVNVNGVDRFLMPCEVHDELLKFERDGGMSVVNETHSVEHIQTDVLGADVTAILRVEHYDELKAALAPECGCPSVPSDAKMSDFPTLLCPKSDEDRIQLHPDFFTELKGRRFEVSEKRDGSSVTMVYSPRLDDEPFAVCSRNMRLKRKTEKGLIPLPWKVCAEIDAERRITDYCTNNNRELAFQGEENGVGIQGNRDCLTTVKWQVFKIYDCKENKYLLPSEARDICKEIGLEYVPVIAEAMSVFDEFTDADSLLEFAEGKTDRGNEREGLVFKSCDYPYVSFKAVSNRYLMKEND